MVARLGLPPCHCDVKELGSLRRRGGGVKPGREHGTDASRASAGPAARAVAVLLPSAGAAQAERNQFLKAEGDSRGLGKRRERGRGRAGEEILATKRASVLMSAS